MRRVIFFAFLALTLPTAALAANIEFNTGTSLLPGSVSAGKVDAIPPSIFVHLIGSNGTTITFEELGHAFVLLPLSSCEPGFPDCWAFGGGTVTVTFGGTQLFTDGFDGVINQKAGNPASYDLEAVLAPGEDAPLGGTASATYSLVGGNPVGNLNGAIATGQALVEVDVNVIPEPGTLGLLGAGVIGLAGVARRKLKLWT